MKTIKIAIFTILFLLLTVSFSFAREFEYRSDVNFPDIKDHEYEHHIIYLYKLGLIDGYSDSEFKPDRELSRGELAKFVFNTFGIPLNKEGEIFPDVDDKHTFFPHIQSLYNAGIIQGYSDGEFKPDKFVTRAEATKYIVNSARYFDDSALIEFDRCDFEDVEDTKFPQYICSLAKIEYEGLETILDTTFVRFRPDENLDRGSMARWVLNTASQVYKNKSQEIGFLDFGDWEGNFNKPADVKDLEVEEELRSAVLLSWDNMARIDKRSELSGFLIDRRERGEDAWDYLDSRGGIDGTSQEFEVEITGTVYEDDEYKIRINGENLVYTADSGDTINDVASGLASLVNGLRPVTGRVYSNNLNTVVITSTVPGEDYSISVSAKDGSGFTKNNIDKDEVEENDEGEDIEDGVILAEEVKNSLTIKIADLTVRQDERYEYRVASFRFIPYQLAKNDYDSQSDMEKDLDDRRNMIIGEWEELDVDTPEDDLL